MNRLGEYILRSLAIWITAVVVGAFPAAIAFNTMESFFSDFLETTFTIIVFSAVFSFPAPFIMLGSFFALDKVEMPRMNKRWILVAIGAITCFVSLSAFGAFIEESSLALMFVPIYIAMVSLSILLWTRKYTGGSVVQNQTS